VEKAIVTPVPIVPKPTYVTAISDYRPISITPILSRLADRTLATKWQPRSKMQYGAQKPDIVVVVVVVAAAAVAAVVVVS